MIPQNAQNEGQDTLTVQIFDGQQHVGKFNFHRLVFGESALGIDPGGAINDSGQKLLSLPEEILRDTRRMVVTHAHGDHFWSVVQFLKSNLHILCSRWTRIFIEDYLQQSGFRKLSRFAHFTESKDPTFDQSADPSISGWYEWGEPGSGTVVGLFSWPHSTPEARGLVVVHIPSLGAFVWMVDLAEPDTPEQKLELTNTLKQIARLPGGVVACFIDSTSMDRTNDRSASEASVRQTIQQQIADTTGVVYFTCFSSDAQRVQAAAQEAKACGRNVAYIAGQSIRRSIGLACSNTNEQGIPYINGSADMDEETGRWFIREIEGLPIVSLADAIRYARDKPSQLIVFAAGTQAEGWVEAGQAMDFVGEAEASVVIGSAMTRLVRYGLRPRRSTKSLKLQESDTVIFSSSVIPDNAGPIAALKQAIFASGAKIIDDSNATVHLSGHGNASWALTHLLPQFVVPIHGDRRKRSLMANAAAEAMPFAKALLADDHQEIMFTANKYGLVSASVRNIPGVEQVSPDAVRVRWFGVAAAIVKVRLQDNGSIGQIVGRPTIKYSFHLQNDELARTLELLVLGFVSKHCRPDGSVREPMTPKQFQAKLKSVLLRFLRDQIHLNSAPYPFPIVVDIG